MGQTWRSGKNPVDLHYSILQKKKSTNTYNGGCAMCDQDEEYNIWGRNEFLLTRQKTGKASVDGFSFKKHKMFWGGKGGLFGGGWG